jgi:ADP-ribose pyrophosphatase
MVDDNRPPPSKHNFKKVARKLDGFFKVDEYYGSYERYDNTMSAEQSLLVFERGDSVSALLFDPYNREVILVEQFRLPTLGKGQGGGWIIEPAAGIVRGDETPRESIIRELREETGYQVNDLMPIATFFVSPGGSTERIFLFYAEVRRIHQETTGGGVADDGENIRLVRLPVAEFFAKLRNQEFEDAKLIIAAQWLKDRRSTMPVEHTAATPPLERQVKVVPAKPGLGRRILRSKGPPSPKFIGYMSGDILNVKDIDVWVNPLNTDMMLDRFNDLTISGVIRFRGAKRFPETKRIEADTIGRELAQVMGDRHFVKPAKVIDTSSGELLELNGVKRIFHVATTKGEIGEGLGTDLETLDRCVDNTLTEISGKRKFKSVLFPMLGTGQAGFDLRIVAPRLLMRAINFFQDHPRTTIERILFLAYSEVDAVILADAMEFLDHHFEPVEAPTKQPR